LTGYHIVALIREWLTANAPAGECLSVCEVLQRRGWEGVGTAHCFMSHCQSEHPGETLVGMQKVTARRRGRRTFVWVDFFSLRQTEKGAFNPLEVVSLIERIGEGMLQIDRRWTYADRTFCILESYAVIKASVKKGGHVQFVTPPVPTLAPQVILCPRKVQVDAKASSTRSAADKEKIDSYVESTIGFEIINATMTSAIRQQLARQRVFAAVRLTVYLGLVGLFLYVVDEASVPVVGYLIVYVPTDLYCDESAYTYDDGISIDQQCADSVNTFVVGVVGMGVIGALWIALSAAVYSLLERRPRMRWAHAPLIKKAAVLQTGSTVQQSVTV